MVDVHGGVLRCSVQVLCIPEVDDSRRRRGKVGVWQEARLQLGREARNTTPADQKKARRVDKGEALMLHVSYTFFWPLPLPYTSSLSPKVKVFPDTPSSTMCMEYYVRGSY